MRGLTSFMSASKKKQIRRENDLANPVFTERQKQELKKAKTHKRNVILGAVAGGVIAVLVILLLVWNTGFFARHNTALTVGDHKYSTADLNYFYTQALETEYSNQQYYSQLYAQLGQEYPVALDPWSDLTTQYVDPDAAEADRVSYHDYFLDAAKESATTLTALYDAAMKNGHVLSESAQKNLDEAASSLAEAAENNGFSSTGAYLKRRYGSGMTESIYLKNVEMSIIASDYHSTVTGAMGDYTDEELEAYYTDHADTLDSYTFNAVYIDGTAPSTTDDEGNSVPATDEAKKAAMSAAKEQAESFLANVKAATGDDRFSTAALALNGTSTTLRENVFASSVSNNVYGEWVTNAEREAGDMEMFEVEDSGYYVLEYLSRARDDNPLIDVRHILVKGVEPADTTGGDADTTDTDTDADTTDTDTTGDDTDTDTTTDDENKTLTMEEAQAKAQTILDEFLGGDQTADRFGELAEQYSEDGRTGDEENKLSKAGGLYTNVKVGDMVQAFNDWCFDPARKEGDTGLVTTEYGVHVMYFQASHDPTWKSTAQSSKKSEEQADWLESVQEGYEAVEGSGFSKVGRKV